MLRTIVSGWKLLALAAILLSPQLAVAQLPVSELTYVYPPGGKQGGTVKVSTGGANLDDAAELVFSHPGIKATVQKQAPGEFIKTAAPNYGNFDVQIAGDVPSGVYDVRVVGRFGISNPRAFTVGLLEEVLDDGSNKSFETAKAIAVNTSVNGRVDASAVDYYKIPLKQGQRVVINCWAKRIDSRLDAALVLFDSKKRELSRTSDYAKNDPMIDFTAPLDGDYIVGVFDFVYTGSADYYYRLDIHERPHVDFVLPLAAKPGVEGEFTIYGRNLPGGEPTEFKVGEAILQKKLVKITAPNDPHDVHNVGDYLTTNSLGVTGFNYQLEGSNRFRMGFADADDVVVEQEPNDRKSPQKVTIPCDFTGNFYPRRDVDWIQFDAKKGDAYWIEVISHQLGLDTDPYMMVQKVTKNDKGEEVVTEVAQIDDPGNRNGKIGTDFDTSTDDPSYKWTADADATYRVMVRDQFGRNRSDPRMVYRLVIRKDQPDFQLFAFSQQVKVANANQVLMYSPVVRKGGAALLRVDALRRDGFAGEIELSVEGLPKGLTTKGAVLGAGATSAWLVFEADEKATPARAAIKVVGKAKVADKEVARTAKPAYVVWGTGNRTQTRADFRVARELQVAICDDVAQASAVIGDGKVVVTSKGGPIQLPVKLTRRGYAADLKLVAKNVPGELKPPDLTLKGEAKDAKLAWTLTNAKAKPGVYSFYLRGDVKIKHVRNAAAIARAEAEQKEVVAAIAQLPELVKQQTAAKDASVKSATDAATTLKQSQDGQKKAAATSKQAADAAKQAADKLAKAKEAAAKDTDNQALKDAVAAAEKATKDAGGKAKTAAEQLAAADKALADSQAKAKSMDEAKVKAETTLKATQEKQKRATAAKKAADKKVADVKKANAGKDMNIAVISSPITLRVVASPLELTVKAPEAGLKGGQKVEVPISIKRLYGFAEAVEVSFETPKAATGLKVNKLSLAKDKSDGKFEVTAAENAAPGDHVVNVRVKGTFNKIPVETLQTITLKVEKP